ncbi:unnamed protein product [Prunus armeniaca]|uniref:Uncharacterized protein n=1 Tax=Prunus armeniaca TaxID=36596 RepID=A0A6J5X6X0_PRUAR|nr:unnamed protein product [Prunus armeniaca]
MGQDPAANKTFNGFSKVWCGDQNMYHNSHVLQYKLIGFTCQYTGRTLSTFPTFHRDQDLCCLMQMVSCGAICCKEATYLGMTHQGEAKLFCFVLDL